MTGGPPARVRHRRTAIAAFGIRGIGSFHYLDYAASEAGVGDPRQVWATTGFVVIVSVLMHGVAVTPIMNRLDHRGRGPGQVQQFLSDPPR